MQTEIKEISSVEYELTVHVPAEELQPELDQLLRRLRARVQLKGFRPGKAPLSLVKKLYGDEVALELAERKIREALEQAVLEPGTYKVIGRPRIVRLDYKPDTDLHAVLRFGVRPEFELKPLGNETIPHLVHQVTDEEVEQAIRRLQREEAKLVDLPADTPLSSEDYAVVDLQRLDEATGTPIIGEKEEGVSFFLDDPRLREELRQALLGKKAGETVRVDLPHGDETAGEPVHTHRYEVHVRETKRRELPELDAAFIQKITRGQASDEAGLRELVRQELQARWNRESRELLEQEIMNRMLALHPIPVPESAVEMVLDEFVEDVRQRNNGRLPEGFDETAFRHANRALAEQQARWMFLFDKVVETYGLEVTEEDVQAFFEEQADPDRGLRADQLRQFYESVPGLMDQVRRRLLTRKVFDALQEQFQLEELDREAYMERLRAQREGAEARNSEGSVR
ncbi:trigger factor [Rhodothermus profundi]|uniref:Trigger factor n=1 Tax=Rhodothermus profundi TaxID=633813 RepID=A0A1M6RWJ2_9BACT|nr:trigger factor [Rhodothermus profundi]SHK36874.1 trigger factor [Rhodothermus profundi]